MSTWSLQDFFPLREVAGKVPTNSRGHKPSIATIDRWAMKGLGGVKLRTIRVGGTKCTCDEWLREFFEALTSQRSGSDTPDQDQPPSDRRLEQVEKRLNEIGL